MGENSRAQLTQLVGALAVAVDGEDEELALHGVVGLHAYERGEALVVPVAVVPREVGTGKSCHVQSVRHIF
jgi:hypothetical protein